MIYVRPIVMTDATRPSDALAVAGGGCWFSQIEVLERGRAPRMGDISDLTPQQRSVLSQGRRDFAGLPMDVPKIMGILNVTPDSFSDGGRFLAKQAALDQAQVMASAADILDVGGESTRPGAEVVRSDEEIARIKPVIEELRAGGHSTAISIDTRKASVASAALDAGATIVNDVSAFGYDADLASLVARREVPVILMHSRGSPKTMQEAPVYENVVLDVYDFLAKRIDIAVLAGISREKIAIDPGIGFGKTQAHNLALIRALSIFHGLGCPILLGASRKRFIGAIAAQDDPQARLPGSLAVALAAVAQGVQILRVHDVIETRQALALWRAVNVGEAV